MPGKYYEVEQLRDIRELVRRADRLFDHRVAYRQLGPKKNIFDYTFHQLHRDMNAFGTGLMQMDLKGKHFALLGESLYQWVLSYVTVINGVGVVVPMDKELMAHDLSRLMNYADCEVIICSDSYVNTVRELLPSCPQIKQCFVMNPKEGGDYEGFTPITQVMREGYDLMERGDRSYLDAFIDVDVMSEILFTSGTTGANKGVMLSQKNIMAVVCSAMQIIEPGKVSMSVLPIHHTFECSCHILGGLYAGLTVCFNDSLKRVTQNLKLFKPEFMIVVPMFLESMMRNIWSNAEKNGLAQHMKYGIKFSRLLMKLGIDKRRKYFQPVHKALGGNLKQVVCGGAPLRNELVTGFDDVGINVVNGYGISECAPLVSANFTNYKKVGTVGKVVTCCKVRIGSPDENGVGEIEVRGDNVMAGYYKDEESTAKSFTEDGWFKTGDLGKLDKDGYVYISGREKNLIILPNGKNVSPEELEELVQAKLEYVKEIVVFALMTGNDTSGRICAACYLDPDWIEKNNITDPEEHLKAEIKQINRYLPGYKQIADVRVVADEFEKTTTKKIKRQLVERRIANA